MRLLVAFLGLMVWPATQGYAEILTNGNLDQTQSVEIVTGFFLPKPSGWINEGSRTISGPYEDEMSSEPWAGPAPTPVTTDGSGFEQPNGCFGLDCAVFFKPFTGGIANGPATGHLYQDNPATAGLTYRLTGWAGAEANALAARVVFAIDFLDAGNVLIESNELDLLPTLFIPNGQAFNYKQYSLTADAPAGTAFIRARASMIDAIANPAGGGQAIVVDDFSLNPTAVPEPETGVLAGAGIVVLAWAWGRKRRVARHRETHYR